MLTPPNTTTKRRSIVAFAAEDSVNNGTNHNQKSRSGSIMSASAHQAAIAAAATATSSSHHGRMMMNMSMSVSPHLLQQRAQMSLLRRKLLPVIGLRRYQHARRTQRENILASLMEQHQYNQRLVKQKQGADEFMSDEADANNNKKQVKIDDSAEQQQQKQQKTFLTETDEQQKQQQTSRPTTAENNKDDPFAIFRSATTSKISNLIIEHSSYLKHWGRDVLEELLRSDRAALERFALPEEGLTYPNETCFSHGLIVLVHGSVLKIPRPNETIMKQHFNHLAQQNAFLEESAILNNAASTNHLFSPSTRNPINMNSTSTNVSTNKKSASILLQRSPLNLTSTNPEATLIKAPAVIGEGLILAEGISDYFLKAETYCQYIFISAREIHKKLLKLPRATIAKTLPQEILTSREVTLRQHYKQTPPLLRCSWITKDMEPKTLYRLMLDLEPRSFLPGEDIAKEGSVAPWMVFIRRGEADLMSSDVVVMKLKPGDTFGEMSVLFGEPRLNTLRSTTLCDVWVLHRRSVGNILRMADSQRSVVRKAAKMRRVLLEQLPRFHSHAPLREQVPYLRGMPDPIFEKMVQHSKAHVFPVGLLMVASSETCDALVLIVQGSCVSQDALHLKYHGGDVLGINCLIPHRWTHGVSATTMVDSFILARPHVVDALKAWGEYDMALRYVKLEIRELKRSLTKDLLLNPPPSNIATSTVMNRQALKSVLDGDYGTSHTGRNIRGVGGKEEEDDDDIAELRKLGLVKSSDSSNEKKNNNNSPTTGSRSASASSKKSLTRDERREQKKIALKKQRFKVRVHKGFKTMISGESSSDDSENENDGNKNRKRRTTSSNNNNPHRQHNHHHHHSGNPFRQQITQLIAKQKLGTAFHQKADGTTNQAGITPPPTSSASPSPSRRHLPPLTHSSSSSPSANNNNNNKHETSGSSPGTNQNPLLHSPTSSVNSASGVLSNNSNNNNNISNNLDQNNNNITSASQSVLMASSTLAGTTASTNTTASSSKIRSARKLQEMYQNPDQYREQLHQLHGNHDLPKNVVREVQMIEVENMKREKAIQKRKLQQQQLSLINMVREQQQQQQHQQQQKDQQDNDNDYLNDYFDSPASIGGHHQSHAASASNANGIAFVDIDDDQHLGALKVIWSDPRFDYLFSDRGDVAKIIAPWPSVTHVYWLNQKLRDEDPHQQEKRREAQLLMRETMLQEALDTASSKRLDVQRYSISLPTKLLDQQKEYESSRLERENEANDYARRLSQAVMTSGTSSPGSPGSAGGGGGSKIDSSLSFPNIQQENSGGGGGGGEINNNSLTSPLLMKGATSNPGSHSNLAAFDTNNNNDEAQQQQQEQQLSSKRGDNNSPTSHSAYSTLNPKSSVNATLTGYSSARRRSSAASVEQAEILARRNSQHQQQNEQQIQRTSSYGNDFDSLNNTMTKREHSSSFRGSGVFARNNMNNNVRTSSFYQSHSYFGNNNYSYQQYYNKNNLAYSSAKQDEPPPLVTPHDVEMILGGLLASVPARVRQQFEFDEIDEEGTRIGSGGGGGGDNDVGANNTGTHRTNASSNNRWVPSEMNRDFLMEEIEDLSLNVDSSLPAPRHFAVYDARESEKLPTTREFRHWALESAKVRIRAAREKAHKMYEEEKLQKRKKMLAVGFDEQAIKEEEEIEDAEHALLYAELTDEDWDSILSQQQYSSVVRNAKLGSLPSAGINSDVPLSQLLQDPEYYLDKKNRKDRDLQTKSDFERKRRQDQEDARLQKEKEEQERIHSQNQLHNKNRQNVPSYARDTARSIANSRFNNDALSAVVMASGGGGGANHHHHHQNDYASASSNNNNNVLVGGEASMQATSAGGQGEGRFSMKAILEEREKHNSSSATNHTQTTTATATTVTAVGGEIVLTEEEKIAREKRREAARLKRKEKREKRKSRAERRERGEENVSDTTDSDKELLEEQQQQKQKQKQRKHHHQSNHHSLSDSRGLASNSTGTAGTSYLSSSMSSSDSSSTSSDEEHTTSAENSQQQQHAKQNNSNKKVVIQPQPPKTARGRRLAARLVLPNNNNNNAQSARRPATVSGNENNHNNNNQSFSGTAATGKSSTSAMSSTFKLLETTFVKRPQEKNSNYIRTARPKHSARLGWAMVPADPPSKNEKMESSRKKENAAASSSSVTRSNEQEQESSSSSVKVVGVNNKEDDDHFAILKNTYPGSRNVPPSPTRSVSTASESSSTSTVTTTTTTVVDKDDAGEDNIKENSDEAKKEEQEQEQEEPSSPHRDVGVVEAAVPDEY